MLIIGNGTVITFDEDFRVVPRGGVAIEEEKILAVEETGRLRDKYPEAVFKNVKGKVIMPGMINTHTHLYSTFARGLNLKTDVPPKNFVKILEKLWWRLDRTLNEEDIYYSALYALLDCIKKGTTTIFDHHASGSFINGSLDIIAEAICQVGIRGNLSYEISDRYGHENALTGLRENERFIKRIQQEKLSHLTGLIGLHASFTLENETLSLAADLSDELKVPFHIHVAEGMADVYESKTRGYKGVAERLKRFRILRPGTLAIHGVHLREEELKMLKDLHVYLIHNPESNMSNAVGMAPVKSSFKNGLMVGLGTDGYTMDMFESIKVANLLQKHEYHHPQAGWEEVFQMAFVNNRRIAAEFFNQPLGILKKGSPADLLVMNYHPPTPINSENAYAHILFGMSGDMVDDTMVGGRMLMEDRRICCLDYDTITERIREQSQNYWKRF